VWRNFWTPSQHTGDRTNWKESLWAILKRPIHAILVPEITTFCTEVPDEEICQLQEV